MKRPAAWVAALCLAAFAGVAWGASARDVAEGRYHLRKANALAADAKCEGAVREYTLAYQKLHDPVVLFNRAECYRRLGQNAAASSDYRAFLDAVPRAPNRAEVEARLAALEGLPPPSARATSPAPVGSPPVRTFEPPPAVPPPVVQVAPPPPPGRREAAAPPPAPEPSSPQEAPIVSAEGTSTAPAGSQPESHRRLWLWAAIGAAVAGGAVGAYFALRSPGASPPATELGNYKF